MRSVRPIVLVFFVGCGKPTAEKYTSDVQAIRVEPADLSLVARPGEPATATFRAVATFGSGEEKAIDLVSWSSSNTSAGTVDDAGGFLSSDQNGGVTNITASHLGIEGDATVTVIYTDDIAETGVDPAAVEAFASASAAEGSEPALAYPGDGMVVPRNLDGLGFMWTLPEGHNLSRIRMQTELSDISIYTAEDFWYSDTDLWSIITATNREGDVTIHVESGNWNGSTLTDVKSGPSIDLTINRFDASGSLLYWSTVAGGVVRVPVGTLDATLYWGWKEAGRCTGCHIISEPLQRMVLTNEGVDGTFTIVDVTNPDKPTIAVDADDDRRLTWKTASPDGRWLIGTTIGSNPQPPWNPQPVLYNLVTGERIKDYNLGAPVGQPDWSPDGSTLVMVRMSDIVNSEFNFTSGEIVLVSWDEATQALGEPRVLVPKDTTRTYNYFYPSWSPDGQWIVYCRSTGDSYADTDAELWLISPDGRTNIRLDAADGPAGTMSSTPRWGPLPDDEVLWLAFSSLRSYPLENPLLPQIWVTAINPELAAKGQDPSHRPFWLPGQETTSNNHLPVWWSQ